MPEQIGYPEAERNRLLRRVDWRFLLADSQPKRVICFAHEAMGEALALISDEVVVAGQCPGDMAHDANFDLAVAANPSAVELQAAWTALRPGGALYGEWNRLPATRARVTRELVQAGFTAAACYWPTGAPERAAAGAWLPLAAPGALRYYARSRSAVKGALQRARLQMQGLALRAAARAGVAMPLCAVAYKPPAGGEHDDSLGERPARAHQLLLTGGLRSINKPVRLLFSDGELEPRLAVKMARVPESLPALANEAAILRAVHKRQGPELAGVPRVVAFDGNGGGLCETALAGAPLWTQLSPDNFAPLAVKATDWQVALAGDAMPQPRDTWWERLAGCQLAWFGDTFGAAVDERLLQQAAEALHRLPDLPLVCEQRDFSPWNVLLKGDDLVVLDWESAELHGLPALDLIYFLTYLALFVEGVPVHGVVDAEQARRVYHLTRDPCSELGSVVQRCLASYTRRLGLGLGVLHPLRLLAWMSYARHEYQTTWQAYGATPGVGVLRQSMFLHLWEEELMRGGA
ncbi:MAG: hypothetical protein U0X20_02680 [Caldilineaceae bacterium]